MKRVKSTRGVEVYETKDGMQMVHIRFQAYGRHDRERIRPSRRNKWGRDDTLVAARRVLDRRRREIAEAKEKGERWQSEREGKHAAKAEVEQVKDHDRALILEVAGARYTEERGQHHARPKDMQRL